MYTAESSWTKCAQRKQLHGCEPGTRSTREKQHRRNKRKTQICRRPPHQKPWRATSPPQETAECGHRPDATTQVPAAVARGAQRRTIPVRLPLHPSQLQYMLPRPPACCSRWRVPGVAARVAKPRTLHPPLPRPSGAPEISSDARMPSHSLYTSYRYILAGQYVISWTRRLLLAGIWSSLCCSLQRQKKKWLEWRVVIPRTGHRQQICVLQRSKNVFVSSCQVNNRWQNDMFVQYISCNLQSWYHGPCLFSM